MKTHPLTELLPWTPEERERMRMTIEERDRQIVMGKRAHQASPEERLANTIAQRLRRQREKEQASCR